MILDVSRHKFFEGIVTLMLFAVAVAIVVGVRYAGMEPAPISEQAPIGVLLHDLMVSHPTLSVLLVVPLFIYAVLSLARPSARVAIYPQGTLAAMALAAITLFGVIPSVEYMQMMVVALLLCVALGRMLYCFGARVRVHHLFSSMLALGLLPLVDATLIILPVVICSLVVMLRGTMRETIVAVVGVLLPCFVYCYVTWLLGGGFNDPIYAMRSDILAASMESLMPYLTIQRMIFAGVVLFLLLSSVILYLGNRVLLSGGARSIWFVILVTFAAILLSLFVFGWASPAIIVALAVIAVLLMPMFFVCIGALTSTMVYVLYIITAIVAVC